MSSTNPALAGIVYLMLVVAGSAASSAETLGDKMREAGWDRVLGTWVHADSNIKVSYAWRFKDRVIEVTSTMGDREAVALVAMNAKTGQVFHAGGDDLGGSMHGTWKMEEGDAVLDATYVTGEGEERKFTMRHQLADDDTLVVNVDGEQDVEVTLTRKKE